MTAEDHLRLVEQPDALAIELHHAAAERLAEYVSPCGNSYDKRRTRARLEFCCVVMGLDLKALEAKALEKFPEPGTKKKTAKRAAKPTEKKQPAKKATKKKARAKAAPVASAEAVE